MSKFNNSNNIIEKNLSYHIAYKMSPKDKLISQVFTSFFKEQKFYGDNSNKIVQNIREVLEEDAKFIANLAIYTRKEMQLRSISHVLASELCKSINGKPYGRETIKAISLRVDDMSEILSYYLNTYGKPIPNSMKKGIGDAFVSFNEYSLSKYNRRKSLKLKDILMLTHVKPLHEEQSNMFKRLLEDNLETPITWETQLSSRGNKKDVWEELIEHNSLSYMAILRNLRNIINANPDNIDRVYETISNELKVKNSKQLPFRYYSAYKTLRQEGLGTSKIYDALEEAIRHSTKNIVKLKGKTFISADVSGSMTFPISNKSNINCAEVALLLMAIVNYICEESITTTFDTRLYNTPMSMKNGIIGNATSINVNGGGTDIRLPIKYLIEKEIFVDRIILLSDNEINRGYKDTCQYYVEQYKKKINPNVWVHAIDMMGYGTQQFVGKNVNILSGWNEKILEFIHRSEDGIETLRESIEKYYFK